MSDESSERARGHRVTYEASGEVNIWGGDLYEATIKLEGLFYGVNNHGGGERKAIITLFERDASGLLFARHSQR